MRVFGGYKFTVNGLNLAKMLNGITTLNVGIYNVKKHANRKVVFSVDYVQAKKVIAYLDEMCYNYNLTQELGVITFLNFLWKRTGLIVGIICFLSVMVLSNFFVADISIAGCKMIEQKSIMETINSLGVRSNTFGRPSAQSIEKSIYQQYDRAAFVQVRYIGMRLVVNIVETQPVPAMISSEVRDIVSEYDGKITKLLVFQGTPLVKAGDTVKKGQVLIGGYRERPDGSRIPVRAMGEAYGEAKLLYTEVFEERKLVFSKTGEYIKESYIDTMGVIFPISKGKNQYETFEVETAESYIFHNLFLPCKFIEKIYYRTESAVIHEDFEKVKKIVVEEAEKNAVINAEKEGKIVMVTTTIREGEWVKYIDVSVQLEKSFL